MRRIRAVADSFAVEVLPQGIGQMFLQTTYRLVPLSS
jgi:hypothetical protein